MSPAFWPRDKPAVPADGRVHSRVVDFSLTVIMSESNEIRLLGLKKNDFEVLS